MTKKILYVTLVIAILIAVSYVVFSTKKNTTYTKVVAITQILPHPSLDKIRLGIIETLRKVDKNIEIKYQSAEGNMATANQIAQSFVGQHVDVIASITTPSSEAVLAQKAYNIPVVFAGITDPTAIGFPKNRKSFQITGVSDAVDPKKYLELLNKVAYGNKSVHVGIIFNAAEANSVSQTEAIKSTLESHGHVVITKSVQNLSQINDAANYLVDKVDGLIIGNDNLVVSAFAYIKKIFINRHRKFIIASDPESFNAGATAACAPDQYQMGVVVGEQILEILSGKSANSIPMHNALSTLYSREINDE